MFCSQVLEGVISNLPTILDALSNGGQTSLAEPKVNHTDIVHIEKDCANDAMNTRHRLAKRCTLIGYTQRCLHTFTYKYFIMIDANLTLNRVLSVIIGK